ncbi:MAG: ABC transporter permease, partial [Deltaproteobacteria bacterium]
MLMRYAAMRLMQLIPMALVVTMVVFFVMMIVPGDPVMVMLGAVDGAQVSREVYDAMRLRLGLDQPLIVQYLNWLSNLLQGDLGTSIAHRTSVLEVILLRLVPTMYLMVGGLIVAVIIAVPAGVLAAIHNNTKWDHLATAFVV